MAQVSSIRTSETAKARADAGLGATNVFALLGVRLKGGMESIEGKEITHERVHTPTSLFAKVRSRLRKDKLIHDLTKGNSEIANIPPGHFVEFEAKLRRNPLIDALEAVGETIGGIKLLQSFKPGQKSAAEKAQEEQLKQIAEQVKRLLSALTGTGSFDLVGDIVPGPGRVVVAVEERYFGEHSAEEIADGHYRVFGKVVRNVLETADRISLLRNTKFAHMPNVLEPLKEGFAATKEGGLSLPQFVTYVESPALQVFPIAIFL
ncbi:MAG TPA: hypothetical protein VJ692_10655 [Nitrospiraceae bacterium]|nr:hypothetical protein [Nitrospiraceae bacterium]